MSALKKTINLRINQVRLIAATARAILPAAHPDRPLRSFLITTSPTPSLGAGAWTNDQRRKGGIIVYQNYIDNTKAVNYV